MRSERLNKLFERKSFRIVLSLFISLILWAYVEYVENPESTLTINNVPVEYVGAETLAENSLVVTEQDVTSVNVRFSGKRNVVARLNRTDITARVDLTEILRGGNAVAGVYQIPFEVQYPDELSGLSADGVTTDYVTVTVEKLITRKIPVWTQFNGNVSSGYRAKDATCELTEITVSGSQVIVANLDHAIAVLSGENLTQTISQETPLVLIDIFGDEVDSAQLTLSEEAAMVTMQVQMVKEVPLKVNLVEGVSATVENTTVTYSTNSIQLIGDPAVLSEVQQIVLGTVDLTDFASSGSFTFPISVPEHTENLSGVTTVTVTVEVLGQATRYFTVENIEVVENTEGYEAEIVTEIVSVVIRGPETSIIKVSADDIRVVADLSAYGTATGTFSATAKIYVDGFNDIDAIGEYTVDVTVTEADGE